MKRIGLMVMLLVAGALALLWVALWGRILLSFVGFSMLWGHTGSGGIGSVSAGVPESFVESVLSLFPSFLLWRVYANLPTRGDRVMARHRRFHGGVMIAGLLLVAAIMGLVFMSLGNFPDGPPMPRRLVEPMFIVLIIMATLPLAAFVLSVIQLFSVVVAFRTLKRDGRRAS
jgi:hypothetical protein